MITYVGSLANGFVNYEDPQCVTANAQIESSQVRSLLGYAFGLSSGEWHPLTWVSHEVDIAAFGEDAGSHHLVSLLLHVLVVTLLFVLLSGVTKRHLESAVVAALFAVHPLNVETVGWVSQRESLLGGFFLMLTLITYARYARKRTISAYLHSFFAAALGVLCSPALTVIPVILLVTDFWPLRRLAPYVDDETQPLAIKPVNWKQALLEKVPFAVLSVFTIVMTRIVWTQPGMFHALAPYSAQTRAANVVLSYGFYLGKMFWPRNLAPIYSATGDNLSAIAGIGLLVGLMVATALAFASAKRRPYITAGWLWYVVSLSPFCGFMQLGDYAIADRYAYLSLIGIFVVLVWGISDLLRSMLPSISRKVSITVKCAVVVVVLTLAVLSWRQAALWNDSYTLMRHTVKVTRNNFVAYHYLGNALDAKGKVADATNAYKMAIAINPSYVPPYINIGTRLGRESHLKAAEAMFRRAIAFRPSYSKAYYNWGVALTVMGKYPEAVEKFNEAIERQPSYGIAYSNLAAVYYLRGDYERSWSYVEMARKNGAEPSPKLLRQLAEEMPEPGT